MYHGTSTTLRTSNTPARKDERKVNKCSILFQLWLRLIYSPGGAVIAIISDIYGDYAEQAMHFRTVCAMNISPLRHKKKCFCFSVGKAK